MKEHNRLWCLVLATPFLLSSCAAFQLGGEVQRGRTALLGANPQAALAHFQRVAEQDPDYLFNYHSLEQPVQTYLGRAYYATGNMAAARQALERHAPVMGRTTWPSSTWALSCRGMETEKGDLENFRPGFGDSLIGSIS